MNTATSWSPTASCTSAVETAESTPPESAESTRPVPTCARMRATCSAMTLPLFQSAGRPAAWRWRGKMVYQTGDWKYLVCLAVWCGFRCKSDSGKLIMTFWCLYAFFTCGFEHSVANMTVLTLGLLNPAGMAVSLRILPAEPPTDAAA